MASARPWYEVLGVSAAADEDTVREAYRSLVKAWHPDRYVDSPLMALAEERLKEINAAYEAASRSAAVGEIVFPGPVHAAPAGGYGVATAPAEPMTPAVRFSSRGYVARVLAVLLALSYLIGSVSGQFRMRACGGADARRTASGARLPAR